MCLCEGMPVSLDAFGDEKRTSDAVELELQMVVCLQTWALGPDLGPPEEQRVLLAAKPSPQHPPKPILKCTTVLNGRIHFKALRTEQMIPKENPVHITIYYIISVPSQITEKRINYSANGFKILTNHLGNLELFYTLQ